MFHLFRSGSAIRVAIIAAMLAAPLGRAQSPEIPIVADLNVVLAVANNTSPAGGPEGMLQGDYEMVVTLQNVDREAITHQTSFDGVDAANVKRRGTITRTVTTADLASAPLQIFGFGSDDPSRIPGATALGPSLAVTRDLRDTGEAPYAFRQWANRDVISGTLRRSPDSPVKFPVLLNGRRVELDAIRATGQMSLGSASRPFETIILDHPRYPISLRLSYGPRDGTFPFTPDFLRDVVRIDYPETSPPIVLEDDCRLELTGIYFDFNLATLQAQSGPALTAIAAALKSANRRARIEGHTDSIGSDRYNDDLSARRAEAVRTALVRDYGIDPSLLTTAGIGERRPIESNDTLAGRARNRRVELVCAGGR